MYANMLAPAGQVGAQLPRENFVTRRFEPSEKASFNMRRALRRAFLVRSSGLLDRAAVRIEPRGAF